MKWILDFLIHLLLNRLASTRPTSQDYALLFKRSSSLALLGLYKIGKKQDTLAYFTSVVRPTESAQHLFARLRVECVVCTADYLIFFSNQTQMKFAEWAELNKTQVHLLFRKKKVTRADFTSFFKVLLQKKKIFSSLVLKLFCNRILHCRIHKLTLVFRNCVLHILLAVAQGSLDQSLNFRSHPAALPMEALFAWSNLAPLSPGGAQYCKKGHIPLWHNHRHSL